MEKKDKTKDSIPFSEVLDDKPSISFVDLLDDQKLKDDIAIKIAAEKAAAKARKEKLAQDAKDAKDKADRIAREKAAEAVRIAERREKNKKLLKNSGKGLLAAIAISSLTWGGVSLVNTTVKNDRNNRFATYQDGYATLSKTSDYLNYEDSFNFLLSKVNKENNPLFSDIKSKVNAMAPTFQKGLAEQKANKKVNDYSSRFNNLKTGGLAGYDDTMGYLDFLIIELEKENNPLVENNPLFPRLKTDVLAYHDVTLPNLKKMNDYSVRFDEVKTLFSKKKYVKAQDECIKLIDDLNAANIPDSADFLKQVQLYKIRTINPEANKPTDNIFDKAVDLFRPRVKEGTAVPADPKPRQPQSAESQPAKKRLVRPATNNTTSTATINTTSAKAKIVPSNSAPAKTNSASQFDELKSKMNSLDRILANADKCYQRNINRKLINYDGRFQYTDPDTGRTVFESYSGNAFSYRQIMRIALELARKSDKLAAQFGDYASDEQENILDFDNKVIDDKLFEIEYKHIWLAKQQTLWETPPDNPLWSKTLGQFEDIDDIGDEKVLKYAVSNMRRNYYSRVINMLQGFVGSYTNYEYDSDVKERLLRVVNDELMQYRSALHMM